MLLIFAGVFFYVAVKDVSTVVSLMVNSVKCYQVQYIWCYSERHIHGRHLVQLPNSTLFFEIIIMINDQ